MNNHSQEDRDHKLYGDRVPNDTHSTEELITEALNVGDADEHAYWEPITVLWHRRSVEVLDAARQLCGRQNPKERELGASILSQLACQTRDKPELFHDERLTALLHLIEQEENEDVLIAACHGLGHLYDPRGDEALLRLKNSPNPDIRHAVAFSLSGELNNASLAAIIELSSDEDSDVRDWATFRLGHQPDALESDALILQDALAARLNDPDEDTRCEAIVGLARYKDTSVSDAIIKELNGMALAPEYNIYNLQLLLEAATELADSKICPILQKLKNEDIEDIYLDEALDQCRCTP